MYVPPCHIFPPAANETFSFVRLDDPDKRIRELEGAQPWTTGYIDECVEGNKSSIEKYAAVKLY